MWRAHASSAHAHGAHVDVDTYTDFATLSNDHAHTPVAYLGAHVGVAASPNALPAPAVCLDAHVGMGASLDAPLLLLQLLLLVLMLGWVLL